MVVDGTSVQLEDTPANQKEYFGQKPGCGFPVMQIVALFNLGSSALERFSFSPHTADEGGMFDVELMEHAGRRRAAGRPFVRFLPAFCGLGGPGRGCGDATERLAWLA